MSDSFAEISRQIAEKVDALEAELVAVRAERDQLRREVRLLRAERRAAALAAMTAAPLAPAAAPSTPAGGEAVSHELTDDDWARLIGPRDPNEPDRSGPPRAV